jgi:amino acid adenylation domain-containing protein
MDTAVNNTHPTTSGLVTAHPKEEALWLLETLVPGSVPNNLSLAFLVDGLLEESLPPQALTAVVRRHETLRTVFHADKARLTRILLAPDRVAMDVERLTLGPDSTPQDALTAFVARPFTLDGGLLVRAAVLTETGTGHDYVCVAVHHLVFDAASIPVFVEELAAAYTCLAGHQALPDELTRNEAALADTVPTVESLAYWHEQMAGFDPNVPDLWCGTADVAAPTLAGQQLTRPLSTVATGVVRSLQRKLRAPEAFILLAAYCLLLDAHGAGPDVVVGSPVSVRPSGAERAIGYHVNVLPLRVKMDPRFTVRELVRLVRETFFNSLMHADVPVDSLTRSLPRAAGTWRNVLFRHVFNYVRGFGVPQFELAGMRARPLLIENGYSKFDIELFVMSADGEIRLRTVYRSELFSRADAELLLERYEALLLAFADDAEQPVSAIKAWGERDHAVIEAANRTAAPAAVASVLQGFHAQAVRTPDAVAVEDDNRTVTYRELWNAAQAARTLLTGNDVVAGDIVAVAMPRGPELAAAVLGTWLASATYMPVDPDHPAPRISYQLADSGAKVILAHSTAVGGQGVAVLRPASVSDAPVAALPAKAPAADPDGHAYLIYTSGSTGKPKGTIVTHRGLANVVEHFVHELAAGPGDGMLWITTFAFDISGLELYVPLVSGGRVVTAPDDARVDGSVLLDLIEGHDVRTIQATPTSWRIVLEKAARGLADRQVLCGGEALPGALALQLAATGCELHHVYGPTETTIWSTSGPVPGRVGNRIDIGCPIRNTQILVTDPAGRELPIGVRGELCIAGHGVAAGYHGRAALTAQRFRQHPRYGRYYRTGDVAYWRHDGTLELIGRSDRQVKLRGNRIELGEIEAVLLRRPGVKAVAVIVHGDPSADAKLIAFTVTDGNDALTVESLWDWAHAELARVMIPQEFIVVDALPTNANEKVDYPALARIADERAVAARDQRRPETGAGSPAAALDDELVTLLIGLWNELLERDDATADSNFFTEGGNSLLGAMLGQWLEEMTGVSLSLAEVFDHHSPRKLAARVRADTGLRTQEQPKDASSRSQNDSAEAVEGRV